MKIYQNLGVRTSRIRDYIIGTTEEAKHLASARKFASCSDLVRVVRMHNEPNFEMKAILFVKVEHLPDDVKAEIKKQAGEDGYKYFNSFCHLIGFATAIHSNSASDPAQTTAPIYGFPLPAPVDRAGERQRNEFTLMELQNFMGDLFPYRGRAIVTTLNDYADHSGPDVCARSILRVFKQHIGILAASQ